MVGFDNWDGLSRGVWVGGFHGRKIYEREKDFSCSWSTHGLDREGLGVVWCLADLCFRFRKYSRCDHHIVFAYPNPRSIISNPSQVQSTIIYSSVFVHTALSTFSSFPFSLFPIFGQKYFLFLAHINPLNTTSLFLP
jgi:hypothetical protein